MLSWNKLFERSPYFVFYLQNSSTMSIPKFQNKPLTHHETALIYLLNFLIYIYRFWCSFHIFLYTKRLKPLGKRAFSNKMFIFLQIVYIKWEQLEQEVLFNPFMRNVVKWPIWPFYNIMHERVKSSLVKLNHRARGT